MTYCFLSHKLLLCLLLAVLVSVGRVLARQLVQVFEVEGQVQSNQHFHLVLEVLGNHGRVGLTFLEVVPIQLSNEEFEVVY